MDYNTYGKKTGITLRITMSLCGINQCLKMFFLSTNITENNIILELIKYFPRKQFQHEFNVCSTGVFVYFKVDVQYIFLLLIVLLVNNIRQSIGIHICYVYSNFRIHLLRYLCFMLFFCHIFVGVFSENL